MDFNDALLVAGALIDGLMRARYPQLDLDCDEAKSAKELYLRFVEDEIGFWTAIRTSFIITAQLALSSAFSGSPMDAAKAVVKHAAEACEIFIAQNMNKETMFITTSSLISLRHRNFFDGVPKDA
jgi:hypothetical protein